MKDLEQLKQKKRRKDICEFIDSIIVETGFHLEKGDDITWEWRKW